MQISDAPDLKVIREAKPTARKPHACNMCRRTIRAGERYKLIIHTLDGEFRSARLCGAH